MKWAGPPYCFDGLGLGRDDAAAATSQSQVGWVRSVCLFDPCTPNHYTDFSKKNTEYGHAAR
jgi:hypothetical protein